MTIGIAVSGPMAGLAAFRALRSVERLGRGAIGGFVSFVALSEGRLLTASVQRGGGAKLFGGREPPEEIAAAPLAGLMSSGPDRPEPLIQFTPADPEAGIVTGHRLPNMKGVDGRSPNVHALALMRVGAAPEAAVAEALAAAPKADAGLIAMDLSGRIALANSTLAGARDDRGEALAEDAATGMRIGVLHNSIFPVGGLAGAAVAAALDSAAPGDRVEEESLAIGLPLRLGAGRRLRLDDDGAPVGFEVDNEMWLAPAWEGSAVYRGDPVVRGEQVVGRVVREVYCIAHDGKVTGGRGGTHVGWRRTQKEKT